MERLKECATKFISLEEEEKKYKEMLSKIRFEKDELEYEIIKNMEENRITDKHIIMGGKKIEYTNTKNYSGVTKTLIKDRLKSYFNNDDETVDKVTEFIYSGRKCDVKTSIKLSDIKK